MQHMGPQAQIMLSSTKIFDNIYIYTKTVKISVKI